MAGTARRSCLFRVNLGDSARSNTVRVINGDSGGGGPVLGIRGHGRASSGVSSKSSNVRTIRLRASGTLNALPGNGRASASSVSAARRKASSVAGAPRNVDSAFQARQGLSATPPSAIRASRTAVGYIQGRRHGDERKGRRHAVAHRAVGRARGEIQWRQVDSRDLFAMHEHGVPFGLVAGEAVEVCQRNRPLSRGSEGADQRVERNQRHGQIGRMRGDTRRRGAEDRQVAVVASGAGQPDPRSRLLQGLVMSRK